MEQPQNLALLRLSTEELVMLQEIIKRTGVGPSFEDLYLSLRGKINTLVKLADVQKQTPGKNGKKHGSYSNKNNN